MLEKVSKQTHMYVEDLATYGDDVDTVAQSYYKAGRHQSVVVNVPYKVTSPDVAHNT